MAEGIQKDLAKQAREFGVTADSILGAGDIDTIAKWCAEPDKALLDPAPGKLTYNILRTANLMKHIEESAGLDPALKLLGQGSPRTTAEQHGRRRSGRRKVGYREL